MFIERIDVEGFKSYATHTTIGRFDERFNAITGLNGSGKSNILDSICFVLGITNLSQVRASKLQDLVYKQGQAGVSKARVTITFNNEDRDQSPISYEHDKSITVTREIVIGGHNAYWINGHKAKAAAVKNFFHSVQLNVNNPHFLIMQGRITKVLNMKPEETRSMIEEAAGTRMYEQKKEAALKMLEKKDVKVREIDTILTTKITPTLENLRKERAQMIKFQSNAAECERLHRFCVAYDYHSAEHTCDSAAAEVEEVDYDLKQAFDESARKSTEAEDTAVEMERLKADKEAQLKGDYKEVLAAKEKIGKELVTVTSKLGNKQTACDEERHALESLTSSASEEATKVKTMTASLERQSSVLSEYQTSVIQLTQEHDDLQKHLQAVVGGLTQTSEDGEAQTLSEQLMAAQREVDAQATEAKSCQLRRDDAKGQLKTVNKDLKAAEKEVKALQKDISTKRKALATAQSRLTAVQTKHSPEREAELSSLKETLMSDIAVLCDKKDELEAQLSASLSFDFDGKEVSRKSRGFSPDGVKGVVAKLVHVNKDAGDAVTALETVAGGRLYNVIVDTAATGSAILKHGKLTRRVTILPLDKIHDGTLTSAQKAAAAKVGGDAVRPALELIGYPEEVEAAMKYIFGRTFVCDTADTAKHVTFNKTVSGRDRCRSVTMDGDVYDPSGTVEGGAPSKTQSILASVQLLTDITAELGGKQTQLDAVDAELTQLAKASVAFAEVSGEVEVKAHEVELLEQQLSETSFGALSDRKADLEAKLDTAVSGLKAAQAAVKTAQLAVKAIEHEVANAEEAREGKLKAVEAAIAAKKQQIAETTTLHRSATQATQELELELASSQTEAQSAEQQIAATRASLAKLEAQVAGLADIVAEVQSRFDEADAREQAHRAAISDCDNKLAVLTKANNAALKAVSAAELSIKRLSHKRSRITKDAAAATHVVAVLQKKHPWIGSEHQFFGRTGTDYDFESRSLSEARKALSVLEEEQAALSKRVNKKAMGMMETAEKEYQDVMTKKQIIANDKHKIQDVIAELDAKKDEALHATFAKVNTDFGSIFSTLLPGATAKLVPPEDGTVLDGLEVKVAFGGVWKESLTELSGGQRSLLALSLILALLLFKPAPMYILDEVDAALDLSHTQNIGHMLRTHFSKSQFIVVSLKQGMFNNANVVFRTKFVDGVSTVTRTVPAAALARAELTDGAAEDDTDGVGSGVGAGAGAGAGAGSGRRTTKSTKSKSTKTTKTKTASSAPKTKAARTSTRRTVRA